jgi:hypothetical protein
VWGRDRGCSAEQVVAVSTWLVDDHHRDRPIRVADGREPGIADAWQLPAAIRPAAIEQLWTGNAK